MTKWSEIKQATLNKLFLDESEANEQGYLDRFQSFANECLNLIANGVKPKTKFYEITTTEAGSVVEMPDDFLSFADMITRVKRKKVKDEFSLGLEDPPENPENSEKIVETEVEVSYCGDNMIILPEIGSYRILYSAEWPSITNEDINSDLVLDIPSSILNCLPSYIASQCLGQDDIQRSTVLNNEFEVLLSRLDTNVMYAKKSYKSEGGWY